MSVHVCLHMYYYEILHTKKKHLTTAPRFIPMLHAYVSAFVKTH